MTPRQVPLPNRERRVFRVCAANGHQPCVFCRPCRLIQALAVEQPGICTMATPRRRLSGRMSIGGGRLSFGGNSVHTGRTSVGTDLGVNDDDAEKRRR